jgi:TPR repeat protein
VFDNRVEETVDLPTWELQQARRRMLANEQISWDEMRALADHGDGLAAFRFAQRIEALNDPALLSDAAFYYATAAYTNRDYAVGPLVRILDRRDVEFSEARLDHIENALRAMALSGDAKAAEALSRFYVSGHPFGRQPERALEFRLDLAEAGDADAAMTLVLEAMSGSAPVQMDEAQIVRLLDIVAGAEDLGVRTTGENLRRMFEAGSVQLRPVARPAPESDPPAEEATE